ncbi:MAG: helix-turn-helix transcriptional regulator [Firmicutes bacterium]|nr:helix-turn-helix transcriptional regulator [Bacillota bacterium]
MLILDQIKIGGKLLEYRNKSGLSQAEAAERAGISDRTYADAERGTSNMRMDTLLKICRAFNITPNDILTEDDSSDYTEDELRNALSSCSVSEQKAALQLLGVYIDSLNKK